MEKAINSLERGPAWARKQNSIMRADESGIGEGKGGEGRNRAWFPVSALTRPVVFFLVFCSDSDSHYRKIDKIRFS